ncbi:MAG: hypothetical protein GY927_09205, partial [bacterium]|nr:hypothetical protein [bacterium]
AEIILAHLIYVKGVGWVNAEDLSVGDRLRRADGGFATVLVIERAVLGVPEMVCIETK